MSNSTDGSGLDALPGSAGSILTRIGRDLIQNIVALCVESVLWAAYIIISFITTRILLRKRTWLAQLLLATVWTMVSIDTAMYFIDVNNTVKEVSYTLTSDSPASLPERYALTDHLPWAVQTALYAFLCNLGDVIVIWRVYVFYSTSQHKWVLYIPLLLLLGSFATSGVISYCAAYSIATGTPMLGGNFIRPPMCKNSQLASYIMTLTTTGVATALISFKAWQYRRTVSRLVWLPTSAKKSRVERTMLIIVESGVLYFIFFLYTVITDSTRLGQLQVSTPNLAFANTIWVYMTSHIISIYPVGVILLVHSQYTEEERIGTLTENVFPTPAGSSSGGGSRQIGSGMRRPRDVSVSFPGLEVSVHKTEFVYGDDIPLESVKSPGRARTREEDGAL